MDNPWANAAGQESWQQHTLTPSEQEVCYSTGISNLELLLKQIHAQHSMLAGIFSNLLVSFPPNIGAEEIMPEAVQTFASFAKYKEHLEDLHRHVNAANRALNPIYPRGSDKNIGEYMQTR